MTIVPLNRPQYRQPIGLLQGNRIKFSGRFSPQGRGIRCWLDEKQLNIGDEIATEIHHGIRYWDKIIVCCSQAALNSYWVDREVSIALEKEEQLYKERQEKVLTMLPLDLDGYLFSDDCSGSQVTEIRRRLAGDFTGWEHDNAIFEREIERLIKALRTDGGKKSPPESKL